MLPIDWGEDGAGAGGDPAATRPEAFRGLVPYQRALATAFQHTDLGAQSQALESSAAFGSSSFSFEVPVASYPGRGELPLSLKLIYNSRVWQKMSGRGIKMVFNIDADWPAPGWRFNLPKLISHGRRAAILMDEDGTRHPYVWRGQDGGTAAITRKARTTDGSFIDYAHVEDQQQNELMSGTARYPDGQFVEFNATSHDHRTLYPTLIADRNGNCTTIAYRGGVGPQIETITDTCGRVLRFHYQSQKGLTAITGPGLDGADRALVRLHYIDQVELAFNFGPNAYVQRPDSVTLLDGLIFPGTNTGYWLQAPGDYSSYGMLRRVRECRGMSLTSNSLNDQGTLEMGRVSASTNYDYPEGPDTILNDAPTYNRMTRYWDEVYGEVVDPEVTSYTATAQAGGGLRTTTVHPDGSTTIQLHRPLGAGMVPSEIAVYAPGGARLQNIVTQWEIGHDSSPRVKTIFVTNGRNNQHKVDFIYGAHSNRVSDVYHYGYSPYQSGVIQRIHTEYEDAPQYGAENAHLLYLPFRVQVFDGRDTCVACTEYAYDNAALKPTPNAIGRMPQTQSIFRGNTTEVRRYVTAANHSSPIVETRRYDECGNLISSEVDGSRTESVFELGTQYLAPSETITGSPDPHSPHRMRTSVDYHDIGPPRFFTDVNGLRSELQYDATSLRVNRFVTPTGASVTWTYNDVDMSVAERVFTAPAPAVTMTAYRGTRFDGKGRIVERSQVLGEQRKLSFVSYRYDGEGRLKAESAPFNPGTVPAWTTFKYDALGRLTESVTPDGGVARRYYDEIAIPKGNDRAGSTMRSVDPIGRQRWALYDPLGRIVSAVSPDPGGDGSLTGDECMRVDYHYDGNSNLTLIKTRPTDDDMIPEEQRRKFRYDSIGRLTHLGLPERGTGLTDDGLPTAPNWENWSEVYIYDQRSNLTTRTESRGIITHFDFADDPLDRLQRVSYDLSMFVDDDYPVVACPDVVFTYVTTGDLTRVQTETVDGVSMQINNFDDQGRLERTSLSMNSLPGFSCDVGYEHDTLGRVHKLYYPQIWGHGRRSRTVVVWDYEMGDTPGRITRDGTALIASNFTFNGAGQITGLTAGPEGPYQTAESYTYDEWYGWLLSQKLSRGSDLLLSQEFDYNHIRPDGTTGRIGQARHLVNSTNDARSVTYTYDALGRLTDAAGGIVTGVWEQHYTYDAYGNRQSVTAKGVSFPSDPIPVDGKPNTAYDPTSNRFDETAGPERCDAAGNQTVRINPSNGELLRCQYDAAGRLSIVTDSGGQLVKRCTYGSSNRCLSTQFSETEPIWYYVWSGNQRIASYVDMRPDTTRHDVVSVFDSLYLGERLLATHFHAIGGSPLTRYEHPDRVGTRFLTDDRSLQSGDSDEYVLPYGAQATDDSRATFEFTSYIRDVNIQLDYAINRYYDRGTARFLQPDPRGPAAFDLTDPKTLNIYAYCGGDPINSTDPLGLLWMDVLVYDYSIRSGNTVYDFYHWEERWVEEPSESRRHGGVGGGGGSSGPDKKRKEAAQMKAALDRLLNDRARLQALAEAAERTLKNSLAIVGGFVVGTGVFGIETKAFKNFLGLSGVGFGIRDQLRLYDEMFPKDGGAPDAGSEVSH